MGAGVEVSGLGLGVHGIGAEGISSQGILYKTKSDDTHPSIPSEVLILNQAQLYACPMISSCSPSDTLVWKAYFVPGPLRTLSEAVSTTATGCGVEVGVADV